MRRITLQTQSVVSSYEEVSGLYPYEPSLSLWRSWEHAAYQRYEPKEPVLDVGCGDSRFFDLLWPNTADVAAVDRDLMPLRRAASVGTYKSVACADASFLPFLDGAFRSAFSNCVLEHVENPAPLLLEVARCLRPGGTFLLSVVTTQLLEWFSSPWSEASDILRRGAQDARARWTRYHHILGSRSESEWCRDLGKAGLSVEEVIPIVPENSARVFLHLDVLWHTPTTDGDVAPLLGKYLLRQSGFPTAFSHVIRGLCALDETGDSFGGAVLLARKTG